MGVLTLDLKGFWLIVEEVKIILLKFDIISRFYNKIGTEMFKNLFKTFSFKDAYKMSDILGPIPYP